MAIIKLFNSSIQISLTLIKFYHNLIFKTDKNFNKNLKKNILLQISDNFKYQKVLFINFFFDILLTLVFLTLLIFLIPASTLFLIFPILVKYKRKRPWKYLTQINCFTLSDICFVIVICNYDNINIKLLLYILSKQKKIWIC